MAIFDTNLTFSLQEIAHLQRCLVCPPLKHLAFHFHLPAHLARSLEILGLKEMQENLLGHLFCINYLLMDNFGLISI